ncbi:MAG: uridine kinase [Myxococcales bacterium]|nr:uridine kinase [Myxococcales bacterium]
MTRPAVVVGIAGGTGSGKTTAAWEIARALPAGRCVVIDHDAYYRDLVGVPFDERAATNFDHPSALENELLCAHLRELREGRAVQKPVYDFSQHLRSKATERIDPAPVVIVEGILVLADPALRELFDVKIFVDTDADVRVFRRIRRDMAERGRSFEDVRDQYYATVRPMHLEFVEPSRQFADLIVPEGGRNRVATGLVIRALLQLTDVALSDRG